MSLQEKTFDFFGKMDNNIDYYILGATSPEKNASIISKIGKYKTTSDFFKYYTNKNIFNLFESLDKLDEIYSDIFKQNNSKITKIDKYISDLSNIILLFNLISKNQKIIKKTITNGESFLHNFYSENDINKDIQNKLNIYIENLITLKKRRKKKYPSLISNENVINKCKKHKTIKQSNPNIITFNRKSEYNIKNKLINFFPFFNDEIKENNNNINKNDTPKFPNLNDNISIINESCLKEKNELNKNSIIKQGSLHSYYTLASKSKFINPEKKSVSKFSNKYIKENLKDVEQNINNLINIENENNDEPKLIYSKTNISENKKDAKFNIHTEQICCTQKNPRRQTFSSINLNSSKEKNMLKDILGYINYLYKKGVINSEEKIKLKQLIISKSEKIVKIYDSCRSNDNKFIYKLKQLIV